MFGAQAQVERMVTGRVGFAEVESYIDNLVGLPDDVKSALWLLAWAETGRQERGLIKGTCRDDIPHTLRK